MGFSGPKRLVMGQLRPFSLHEKNSSTKLTFLGGLSVLLLLHATTLEMIAQQSEVDRKSLAEIRAKAEKGDTEFRYELGAVFNFGNLGVAKDQVESYKWCLLAAGQGDEKAK